MKLERGLQLKLLQTLSEVYPDSMRSFPVIEGADLSTFTANLWYLTEHGLAEAKWSRMLNGPPGPISARITAAGLDFLADDGGLSAILGIVTVRLHEDTIKALLVDQVEKSNAPATVKTKLVDQIKSLPAEATKALTLEAIKAGLANVPQFIDWLQTTLAS
ncbi:hypothetical protein C7I87_28305 [Mesorhizobium sp. SARCC-RB16n]|uniref:hypothetical protein n=1 Tax=Mesorhizobium sp. SARCC-RB16n TaxID=2116687 RepID=UPI00122F097E|nr:hypothetical protein [Mesorhizobium sp. SARCC-RB16n]KAA3447156.1 hypothetical protein C7I87_28305 [Mesorhizobium sp. SARCC-RB16n]